MPKRKLINQLKKGLTQMSNLFEPIGGGSRNTDPHTSKLAYAENKIKFGTQRHLMLNAYALADFLGVKEMTSEMAFEFCKQHDIKISAYSYWKRISELVQMGLLEYTNNDYTASSGSKQKAYAITTAGKQMTKQIA